MPTQVGKTTFVWSRVRGNKKCISKSLKVEREKKKKKKAKRCLTENLHRRNGHGMSVLDSYREDFTCFQIKLQIGAQRRAMAGVM